MDRKLTKRQFPETILELDVVTIPQLALALELTYWATAKRLSRYKHRQLVHEPDPEQKGTYCLTDGGIVTLEYLRKVEDKTNDRR